MLNKIILASKSKIRKKILDNNNITNQVEPSNVDEDIVKESLLKEQASPSIISKNLAELKANKVSLKFINQMVLGADSVIDLDGELISKPQDRKEAFDILKKGGNISAVFRKDLPRKFNGYKVINADQNDLRFLDGHNIIAGLVAKGKAKKDYSGFVLDV